MQVLIQLNEIAIYLTKPSACDGDGAVEGSQHDSSGGTAENNLELASQFLHIALSHASGVVKGLLDQHQHNGRSGNSSEDGLPSKANRHRTQEHAPPTLTSEPVVAPDMRRDQPDTTTTTTPDQLLPITNLDETCNAVCLLWYNLALIQSRQERWAEAQTTLSIVAAMASAQFLEENVLPLLVTTTERHRGLLPNGTERCHHRHPERTCRNTTTAAATDAVHEKEQQQELHSSTIDAVARQCIHSLQATTAILGTLCHPMLAHILSTLGNVYAAGASAMFHEADHNLRRHTDLALLVYDVTLTVQHAVFGPTHARVSTTVSSIVALHASRGHHGLAYQGLQKIHHLQLLRKEEPQTIASTLWDMGVLQYSRREDYPAALELFQRALLLLRTTSSSFDCSQQEEEQPFQREIAATLNSIGFVLHRMHRHQSALQYCTCALRMLRSPTGNTTSDTKDTFRTLYHIALVHSELGHSLTAFQYYEQAAEQAKSDPTELQQCELTELVKIFLLMARLALDTDATPGRALHCCHQATESLFLLAASNTNGNGNITAQRQFWMDLAELRLSCGDVRGGLQTCTHMARNGGARSCHYSFPEALASAYYITQVAAGTEAAALA